MTENTPQPSSVKRLDQYVVEQIPRISRTMAVKLIESGSVLVSGALQKPSYRVKETDQITIDYHEHIADAVPEVDVPILYEDDDVLVLNKPAGLLTHSKGAFNAEATIATFIRSRTRGLDGERAGIVHRLDRATSGVIICAKNPAALSCLQKQFSQRKAKKTYIAIVAGRMPHTSAVIDMPIERNPKKPQTFRVGSRGKPAITGYHVLEVSESHTLLQLMPQTGRTHQLRVHLKELGHPIIGDTLYGGLSAERLFLHAAELEITLPSHERKTFSASVPQQFHDIMES